MLNMYQKIILNALNSYRSPHMALLIFFLCDDVRIYYCMIVKADKIIDFRMMIVYRST